MPRIDFGELPRKLRSALRFDLEASQTSDSRVQELKP
jgi:hypothetical protein